MSREPVYVSVDCETAGPIPGEYSLLSIGASVVGDPETAFYAELDRRTEPAPGNGRIRDEATEAWVTNNVVMTNPRPPRYAAYDYKRWLEGLPGRPVFVGYPAVFDWQFSHWLLEAYCGPRSDPFGFSSAVDLKTLAMAVFNTADPRAVNKKVLRAAGFRPAQAHTHNALDDAREQAELFEFLRRSVDAVHNT